jgi:endonuclease/exonuclease/phosphatase family metal-dependent hydrolase
LFWPAIFASYAIPALLILNFLVLCAAILFKRILAIFPFLSLAIGAVFMMITYNNDGTETGDDHDLSVLSYNVHLFRPKRTYSEFSNKLIEWVANDSSAVKCFQEYCTSSNIPGANATGLIREKGYNSFVYISRGNVSDYDQGLAIFSKYDILDTGTVWTTYGSNNAGIYADILVGSDTLRTYNVHLESMRLSLHQYRNTEKYTSKLMQLFYKLKVGAQKRAEQIDMLLYHCSRSPYPFIICGDFNDTPYSYNYFRLREDFMNAFEEAGNGFGFSFNSILFFLRIDHQFYGSGIEAMNYRVDRSVDLSDHFPTRGFYQLGF